MSRDVLLMTSAIASPPSFQAIKDRYVRLRQTLCSLVEWIRHSDFQTIVLCDGTDPAYDFTRIRAYATEHGKTLETIIFQESDRYLTLGKSYAEGEVLERALTVSAHLKDNARFWKVTGRTFVRNSTEIAAAHTEDAAAFAGPAFSLMPKGATHDPFGPQSVWTQYYLCSVPFFKAHLLKAYEATNDLSNPIECEFFRRLQGTDYAPLAVRPFIVGRNGGLDVPYDADFDPDTQNLAATFL